MNIKVIKDNGLLKEGDILIWDDSLKLYSLDKTEEDHGENISSSLSISYKNWGETWVGNASNLHRK